MAAVLLALRAWHRLLHCTLASARLWCQVEHAAVTLEIIARLPRLRAVPLLSDGVGVLMVLLVADFGILLTLRLVG